MPFPEMKKIFKSVGLMGCAVLDLNNRFFPASSNKRKQKETLHVALLIYGRKSVLSFVKFFFKDCHDATRSENS